MPTVFQIIRDVIVSLVGAAGLVFGIYKYLRGRETKSILEIDVSVEVFPITSANLVDVCIQIKNTGKAAVYTPPAKLKEAVCSMRRVPSVGEPTQLHWEQLPLLDLLGDSEYLNDADWNLDYPDEPFIFEPGATDRFHVFFRTEYHGAVWVRAVLVDQDDYKWRADRLLVLP